MKKQALKIFALTIILTVTVILAASCSAISGLMGGACDHEGYLTRVSARAADCATEGWDAYEACSHCGYTTKVSIEPLGHIYGEYIPVDNGTHYRVCARNSDHRITEPCSGGNADSASLPICEFCNSEYSFKIRAGNSDYGYRALAEYPSGDKMQQLYRALTATAEGFLVNDSHISPENGYYVIGEYDLTEYSLSTDEAMAVWKVFYVSTPAYYWLDASVVTRGDSTLVLTIADDYANGAYRRECDVAIEEMRDECSALIDDGMTDLEKAMVITEYIVKNIEYAYESDGKTPVDDMWAHSMTGFAMRGFGVCEAYAKSFMYLCELNGVECIIGTGYGKNEAHAWNYVQLDGEWYGADITWTDNSGDEAVFDYFGLSAKSIFADHTSHSSTVLNSDFIYKTPDLADKDIDPTALYKNGEYVGMYMSIDSAFLAMTDPSAEYEINIGYFSFMVGSPVHSVTATKTPDVKKLTVTGKNQFVGEEYLDNNSVLALPPSFTLDCDLVLKNVRVEQVGTGAKGEINLSGNTLTLDGKSVQIIPRITGLDAGSILHVNTQGKSYMTGGVNIYSLVSDDDMSVFGADSYIKYSNTDDYYTQNGAKVRIENKT